MASRLFLFVSLLFFLQKTTESQSRRWVVADTAWANQIFPRATLLAEGNQVGDTDTAWVLFNQILEVYGSTVGLNFEVPYDAIRLKGFIRYWEGDYSAAVPLLHRCIGMGKKVFGPRGRALGTRHQ